MARSYYIRARTIDGKTVTVGPYEKRYCEQVLGDIRNRIAVDDHAIIPSRETPVEYCEIDLNTVGMEPCDDAGAAAG
ncbi:MAG: hypothetical protein M3126_07230 [Candidatus Eremiobacteraeota bacterium]|nr:hypothetical protein [Candidatus Eremiobacteraeota bacterium]